MKLAVYEGIVQLLADTKSTDLRIISKKFPDVPYNTIVSICSQLCQHKLRGGLREHFKSLNSYIRRYESGESIVTIAASLDLPACTLARLMIPRLVPHIASNVVTRYLRQPELLADDNQRLAMEVESCVQNDFLTSPHADTIRTAIGAEYEYILQEHLYNLGVPYKTEQDLREEGYPKTPDIKLLVPIVVDGQYIVNWIDSKAMFGDEPSFRSSLDQFRSYTNRFGSGMVIYWFDFVDSLNNDTDVSTNSNSSPNRNSNNNVHTVIGNSNSNVATNGSSSSSAVPGYASIFIVNQFPTRDRINTLLTLRENKNQPLPQKELLG